MRFDTVPRSDPTQLLRFMDSPVAPSTDTTPIVGSSGSTPLHFAAANGHTNAVRALELPLLGFCYRPALRAHQINSNGIGDVVKGWE
jgi:hypothetical protein